MALEEDQILADVRVLVKQQNYEEARRLLLAIPDNATAQKWLLRLNAMGDGTENGSNPYRVPSQFKPAQLSCQRCQLQLGKEAIQCKERPYGGCLYEYEKKIDIHWGQLFGQIVVEVLMFGLAIYLLLLAHVEWFSLASAFYVLIGGFLLFVVFTSVPRLIPIVDKLYNQKTGEKWQQSRTYGVTYRPLVHVSQSVKNPPKLRRPLSAPASTAVLYDPQLYDLWQPRIQDIDSEKLAYVLLVTTLQLVSEGYLEIWFAPTYSKWPFRKDLQRIPNNDFRFVLTDLGKRTKFVGKIERKAKKFCQSAASQHHDWLPGAELILLLSVLARNNTGHRQRLPAAERKRRDRLDALRGAVKDAAKSDVLLKKNGRYYPNPDRELTLKQDAAVLAQLVEDYCERDPHFVKTLQKQMTNLMSMQMQRDLAGLMLGRQIGRR